MDWEIAGNGQGSKVIFGIALYSAAEGQGFFGRAVLGCPERIFFPGF